MASDKPVRPGTRASAHGAHHHPVGSEMTDPGRRGGVRLRLLAGTSNPLC
jgi:hypothetical protein